MSDLNSVSVTGRLAKPAELKYLQSGTAVWTARIANGYGFGDNKGTNWLNVQVFGKRAESLGKLNLDKGAQIAVTGELRIREYGEGKWSHDIAANDVHLIGGRPDSSNGTPRSNAPAPTRRDPPPATNFDSEPFADEIPFISSRGTF